MWLQDSSFLIVTFLFLRKYLRTQQITLLFYLITWDYIMKAWSSILPAYCQPATKMFSKETVICCTPKSWITDVLLTLSGLILPYFTLSSFPISPSHPFLSHPLILPYLILFYLTLSSFPISPSHPFLLFPISFFPSKSYPIIFRPSLS